MARARPLAGNSQTMHDVASISGPELTPPDDRADHVERMLRCRILGSCATAAPASWTAYLTALVTATSSMCCPQTPPSALRMPTWRAPSRNSTRIYYPHLLIAG